MLIVYATLLCSMKPWKAMDIQLIDRAQRRATMLVHDVAELSYDDRLEYLGLTCTGATLYVTVVTYVTTTFKSGVDSHHHFSRAIFPNSEQTGHTCFLSAK